MPLESERKKSLCKEGYYRTDISLYVLVMTPPFTTKLIMVFIGPVVFKLYIVLCNIIKK